MAEESVDLSASPEITEKGKSHHRRNSTGKLTSSSGPEKTLPIYLRASTGSCHDFCKYGKKHAVEVKPRRPFPHRAITRALHDEPMAESLDSSLKKVASTGTRASPIKPKPKTSPAPGNHMRGSTYASKQGVPLKSKKLSGDQTAGKSKILHQNTTKEPTTGRAGNVSVSESQESWVMGSDPSSRVKLGRQKASPCFKTLGVPSTQIFSKAKGARVSSSSAAIRKPKGTLEKCLSSSRPSAASSRRRHSEIGAENRSGTSRADSEKVAKSSRLSLTPDSLLSRAKSVKTSNQRSLKHVLSPKIQNKIKKAGSEQCSEEQKDENENLVQEKTLYVIKMEDENMVVESNRNSVVESSPHESFSQHGSSSLPPPPLSTQEVENRRVIEAEDDSQEDQGISEDTVTVGENDFAEDEDDEVSEYTVSEDEDGPFSESSEAVSADQVGDSVGEICSRQRKDNVLKDEDSQTKELKFRRGKVIDIQSQDSLPRRLKFRRGRVLGENKSQRSDERRKFKTSGEGEHTNNGEPRAEKVVLRHQDVRGKRDAQGLFNNVIEETASKLVETRKSKVKALVGAFETVISLQDNKPSGNTPVNS